MEDPKNPRSATSTRRLPTPAREVSADHSAAHSGGKSAGDHSTAHPVQTGIPFPAFDAGRRLAWDPDRPILVGTSGYSFSDWVGPFYPPSIAPSQMLTFYSDRFPIVEINSTFYRIPHPRVMEQMETKTPARFRFMVKAPRSVSHERLLDDETISAFRDCLEPLRAAGKLDGVLLQFPWGFKPSPASWRLLEGTRRELPSMPIFVEFRHAAWARPETFTRLRDQGLGFCVVDEPRLEGLMPPVVELTSPVGYVRLHGRNTANWWRPRDEGGHSDLRGRGQGERVGRDERGERGKRDRYDYLYSEKELREWMGKIQDLAARAEKVYVFFNNCHAGQAAKNAQLMQQLLLAEA